jgi:hypothetical protein
MAIKQETISVNGSMSNISISGNSSKSGSMSWTLPTLPDNAEIISTSLVADMSLSMILGSATYTINGTSYSSSSSISIDLGTNLINNIDISAKGNSRWSWGTLSASNIVYTITYQYIEAEKPTITITNVDKQKISDEYGYDECICKFISDVDLSEWEARATYGNETTGHGIGLIVESGSSLTANTEATVSVLYKELTNGDGNYVINIYGKSTDGIWSDDS